MKIFCRELWGKDGSDIGCGLMYKHIMLAEWNSVLGMAHNEHHRDLTVARVSLLSMDVCSHPKECVVGLRYNRP